MSNFLLPGVVMIRTWGRFLLRDIRKNEQIQLSSNLNTMNLKLFPYHGAKYRFKKKFKKHSGENIKPLGAHRNMGLVYP